MTVGFFFPSRKVGGTELISYRLAKAFFENGSDILVVDYQDGFLPNRLKSLNIPFKHVYWPLTARRANLEGMGSNDLLIMYHFHINMIPSLTFLGNPNVLICEMQKDIWYRLQNFLQKKPLFFPPSIWQMPYQSLISLGSLFVLEKDSLREIQSCGLTGMDETRIMPIPMDEIATHSRAIPDASQRTFCSIGWDHPRKIIPAGWAFSRIQKEFDPRSQFSYICRNPEVSKKIFQSHFPEIIPSLSLFKAEDEELRRYLAEKVFVYIGMGTSLLDAGKLGIPALIIDSTLGPYPSKAKVRHLYMNALNNLGCPKPSTAKGVDLIDAVKKIECEYAYFSEKTRRYVDKNHSVDNCLQKLLLLKSKCHFFLQAWRSVPGLHRFILLIKLKSYINKLVAH